MPDVVEVRPHLWIGGKPHMSWMDLRGFELIVMCAPLRDGESRDAPTCSICYAPFGDDIQAPSAEERRQIDFAAREAVAAVRAGKKTVVLCREGKNRSGLVVALAIRVLDGVTGRGASLRRAPRRRLLVHRQLLHFAHRLLRGVQDLLEKPVVERAGAHAAHRLLGAELRAARAALVKKVDTHDSRPILEGREKRTAPGRGSYPPEDTMIITAKFASLCPCCSLTIAVGSRVEWSRGAKAVHVACVGKPVAATVAAGAQQLRSSQPRVHQPEPLRRPVLRRRLRLLIQ